MKVIKSLCKIKGHKRQRGSDGQDLRAGGGGEETQNVEMEKAE